MAQSKLRNKLVVNPKLQGTLLLRVVIYWLACIATMEFFSLAWTIATGPDEPSFAAYIMNYDWRAVGGRLLLATLVLVPIVWDMLFFSRRFVGPIFRIRGILRGVARGNKVEPVQLYPGEYWHGLVDDLNAALQHLDSQGASAQIAPAAPDESAHGFVQSGAEAFDGPIDTLSVVS